MSKLLAVVGVMAGSGLLFLITLAMLQSSQVEVNNSAANLAYARAQSSALLISANAQASLTNSQANQSNALALGILMTSLVPWGILFTVSLLGLGVLGLCIMMIYWRQTRPPQIIYIPRPELSRREVWQLMTGADSLTLEQSRDMIAVSSGPQGMRGAYRR